MNKLHQNLLTARLEDAHLNGCSHITWDEIYYWYDVQKIAAGTRRDLQNRWDDITDGEHGRLMQIEGRGGIFIFGEKKPEPVYPDTGTD